MDSLQDDRGIDAFAEGVGGISQEILEQIRENQRQDGGEEQGDERGDEHPLFLHQIAENPPVRGQWFLQFRLGHGRMGNDEAGGVNGGKE